MAVNKLLVAFDESEGADRALAMAASLAAVNPEAHVDVVYVVPIPLLDETQMANFKDILDMMISDGEDLLAEAEQKMGEDVAARTDSLLLTGTNPATEIVKLIGQRDYDLLIVGNRGLSGLKEYMGGRRCLDRDPPHPHGFDACADGLRRTFPSRSTHVRGRSV